MEKTNLNFLIVEDDLTYAIRLQMLVEELGYDVLERVDNSTRALELIYSQKPDFVLMDIEIKGQMTGLDIAETIKDMDIPVLFITSFNDDSAYARAENIGATAFLVKPIDGYSLKSAIKLAVKNLLLKVSRPAQQNAMSEDDIDALFHASLLTEPDWQRFQRHFEKVFPGLLSRLKIQYPELTSAEQRLLLLTKIGLKTRETANLLGISPDSVGKLRYRFKKKLGLSEEELLEKMEVRAVGG